MPRAMPRPPLKEVKPGGSILLDLVDYETIETLDDEQIWSYWQLNRIWREEASKKAIRKVMKAASAEEVPKKAINKVTKAARLAEKAPKKAKKKIKKVMKAALSAVEALEQPIAVRRPEFRSWRKRHRAN